MSEFLERLRDLISAGEVRISEHGYDELAEDQLTAREMVAGVQEALVVEEYHKPVVLVTAYRPDPERWDESFMKRR